jgi:hypothetical protein
MGLDVSIKQHAEMFFIAETSSELHVSIKLVRTLDFNGWLGIEIGQPALPKRITDGIINAAEALGLIPWRLAPGVELPDPLGAKYVVDDFWKLDRTSSATLVTPGNYVAAAVMSWTVPSFYVIDCVYIRENDSYSSVPASIPGLVELPPNPFLLGTAFMPALDTLYSTEILCASRHYVYNTTMVYLSIGALMWAGIPEEDLTRPHILFDYDRWIPTNYYEADSLKYLQGAQLDKWIGGYIFRSFTHAVGYHLLTDMWTGYPWVYYPPRVFPPTTPKISIIPPLTGLLWRLGRGKLGGGTGEEGPGENLYEDFGNYIFLGDDMLALLLFNGFGIEFP